MQERHQRTELTEDPMLVSYQGRPLPKPDEELVDQGLQFDIGTLLLRRGFSRRGLLGMAGLGAAGLGLAACGTDVASADPSATQSASGTTSSSGSASASGSVNASATAAATASGSATEIPDETAGPYPGDGSNGPDVLEQSGVVRQDIRSSFGTSTATAEGVPMTLELTVTDLAQGGVPFAGAAVYAWHCTREGGYSMYSSGLENENYLRGVQIADDQGKVNFSSIFPGCYSGRWPHIHFEVYAAQADITDATKAIATSQVALPQASCDQVYATAGYEASVSNLAEVSLTSDNVFGDDGGEHQLGTATGSVSSGYRVTLPVAIDTRTEPTGGAAPGGGPGR